nr:immunoglobulin light chain junction region [Macaca mulatta]
CQHRSGYPYMYTF